MMEIEKKRVSSWFWQLRNEIISKFEALEHGESDDKHSNVGKVKFEKRKTHRPSRDNADLGSGEMAIMRDGHLFEKVGVNISTVYGELSETAVKVMTETKRLPNL